MSFQRPFRAARKRSILVCLSLGTGGGNLLTPTEQEKTIKDLTSEQKSHGAEAAKAIEKRE